MKYTINWVLICVLLISGCFFLTACGNIFCPVKSVDDEQGESILVYEEQEYYVDRNLYRESKAISIHKSMETIGQNSLETYHSYTKEQPMYIIRLFKSEVVYVRSDYDYKQDTFTIKDTEISFVLRDSIIEISSIHFDPFNDGYGLKTIYFSSQQCPGLETSGYAFLRDGKGYIYISNDGGYAYEITDDFCQLLSNEGILRQRDGSLS